MLSIMALVRNSCFLGLFLLNWLFSMLLFLFTKFYQVKNIALHLGLCHFFQKSCAEILINNEIFVLYANPEIQQQYY